MLIHYATTGGHLSLVKYLNMLKHGVDVNSKSKVSAVNIICLFHVEMCLLLFRMIEIYYKLLHLRVTKTLWNTC